MPLMDEWRGHDSGTHNDAFSWVCSARATTSCEFDYPWNHRVLVPDSGLPLVDEWGRSG